MCFSFSRHYPLCCCCSDILQLVSYPRVFRIKCVYSRNENNTMDILYECEERRRKNTIINSFLKYGRKSQMILFNLLQIIIFTLCLLFVDFTTFSPCLSSLTTFLVHRSFFCLCVSISLAL